MSVAARSGGLDAVRVVALVAVVVGHVWTNVDRVHDAVFAWHVPVFFFLTGLLLRPGRSLRSEARRRLVTLGVPYLVWLVVLLVAYGITTAVAGRLDPAELWGIANGVGAVHRPFHTVWFLASLLATALLARLLAPLPLRWQLLAALAAAAAGTVAGPLLAETPLRLGTAVPCLPFLIAGVAARRVLPRVPARAAVGALLVAGGCALLLAGVTPVDLKGGDVGTPVLGYVLGIGISAGLVLLGEAVFDRLPARASAVVSALAVPAVVVLLGHPVVLWLLRTPGTGRVPDLLLCLLIPWAVGLLVVRTPLAPLLAGTAQVPRRRTPARARGPVRSGGPRAG